MLYINGRKILVSTAIGAVVGVGAFVGAASNAWAVGNPPSHSPSLSAAVRAAVEAPAVAPTQAASPAKPAASPGAGIATPAMTSAPPAAEAKNAAKEPAKEEKPETIDGISLSGVSPLTEEQLHLEQKMEDEAARALEEERKAEEYNRKSFKSASEGLLPLSPEQVRTFMKKLEATQESAQPPSGGAPKGEVKVVGLSLDPGGEPPQVNLAAGYVTTIALIDQTGEPWPIMDVGVGGNFEVTPTQAGSHVVRVVPLTRYGNGNLSILLKDLSTPIIFRLNAGGSAFHMRFDARVPELGPMAKTPLIQYRRPGPVAGDAVLSMLLENAPPKEAKRVRIGGVDARTMAWQMGERLYVRTPLSLLSPAWNASVSSSDGMTVYEIGNAPVLLMSDNGAMIRARLLREEANEK